jgi:hypothetical protein
MSSDDDDFEALIKRLRQETEQPERDKQRQTRPRQKLASRFALLVHSPVHAAVTRITPQVNNFADLRVGGYPTDPDVIAVHYTRPPKGERIATLLFSPTETGQVATEMMIPGKPVIQEAPIPLDSFSRDFAERAIKRIIKEAESAV